MTSAVIDLLMSLPESEPAAMPDEAAFLRACSDSPSPARPAPVAAAPAVRLDLNHSGREESRPHSGRFPFRLFGFRRRYARDERRAALIARMERLDLAARIGDALRAAFKDSSTPVQRIARIAGCSETVAKEWYAGHGVPSALYLLRLAAAVPQIAALIVEVTGLCGEIHPEIDDALCRLEALRDRLRGER